MFLPLLAPQLVSEANAVDEKHELDFHITPTHYTLWQRSMLLRSLLCEADLPARGREHFSLRVDPV